MHVRDVAAHAMGAALLVCVSLARAAAQEAPADPHAGHRAQRRWASVPVSREKRSWFHGAGVT